MQTTSPYWYQESEFTNVKYIKPITRTLGFNMKIPWPAPVTVGAIYAGEGAMPDRREMNTTEYRAWKLTAVDSSTDIPWLIRS